jgi:starvation-inducible outer membrane lipoprotein
MKKLVISALLVLAGSYLLTSCTTVPRDTPNATTTNTSTSRTYSK